MTILFVPVSTNISITTWLRLFGLYALLGTLLANLVGCAAGPKVSAVYEPRVDFTRFKTFSVEPAEKGADFKSLQQRYVEESLQSEFEARGLTPAAEGDLRVLYRLAQKDKIQSESLPPQWQTGYDIQTGSLLRMQFGQTEIHQITEGILIVEVVDAKAKEAIWQGQASEKIRNLKDTALREQMAASVHKLMQRYPLPTLTKTPAP